MVVVRGGEGGTGRTGQGLLATATYVCTEYCCTYCTLYSVLCDREGNKPCQNFENSSSTLVQSASAAPPTRLRTWMTNMNDENEEQTSTTGHE